MKLSRFNNKSIIWKFERFYHYSLPQLVSNWNLHSCMYNEQGIFGFIFSAFGPIKDVYIKFTQNKLAEILELPRIWIPAHFALARCRIYLYVLTVITFQIINSLKMNSWWVRLSIRLNCKRLWRCWSGRNAKVSWADWASSTAPWWFGFNNYPSTLIRRRRKRNIIMISLEKQQER